MTSTIRVTPVTFQILAAGFAAFFTCGVIQAMYGPAFPLFQSRFGISASSVGLIASAHFLGTAFGPPLCGLLLNRFSVRRVVVFNLLVLAAGVAVVAVAPLWPLAVLGALVGGLGLGGVSGALNAAYANLGTQPVNLVNALFGVGSVTSPQIVAAFGGSAVSWPFLFVSAFAGLTLLAARLWGFPEVPPKTAATAGQASGKVGFFALILVFYVSLEVGFGAWAGKHLEYLGAAHIATVISAYWGGLTVGRILTGLFGGRVAPEKLVLSCAVLATLCALLATLGPLTLTTGAYVLAGLMLGPIFGTTLAWMSQHISARLVPYLLMSGSVGGILTPVLLGWSFASFGAGAIPATLMVIGILLCGMVLLTMQQMRGTRLL